LTMLPIGIILTGMMIDAKFNLEGNKMKYILTLRNEIVHVGNKKNNDRVFRVYKKKGVKIEKHITTREVIVGELY